MSVSDPWQSTEKRVIGILSYLPNNLFIQFYCAPVRRLTRGTAVNKTEKSLPF